MLLTGQRKGEILKMRWSDIHDGCWWLLPGTIELADGREILGTKNGKPQTTYLTSPVLGILEARKAELGPESDWVFARPTNPDLFRPSVAFYDKLPEIRETADIQGWKPHDLRRTLVTSLSRLGCPKEIRMAIVNHTSSHVHDAVYDMWEHAPEKMHWMTRWVEFLEAIENGDAARLLPYAAAQVPKLPSSPAS